MEPQLSLLLRASFRACAPSRPQFQFRHVRTPVPFNSFRRDETYRRHGSSHGGATTSSSGISTTSSSGIPVPQASRVQSGNRACEHRAAIRGLPTQRRWLSGGKSPVRSRANAPVKPSLQPSCLWPWRCSSQGTPLRYATNVSQQSRGYAVGDESVKEPTAISVERYHEVADAYLEGVQQSLEELSEADESVDVEFSAGVLTAVIPSAGTYVINKQPPNKQIWLSSPVSGPKRYDYVSSEGTAGGEWVYLRDGSTMTNLLKEEIDITVDKHGDE